MADDKLIINIETQVDNSQLDKGIQEINKKVDNIDKTIDIQTKIDAADAAKSLGDLKKAMKDLKSSAVEFGEGSLEFERVTAAAGELKKRMDDVNEQLAITSQDGFGKLSGQLNLIKNKLLDLDFSGARKGIEGLGSVVTGLGPATTTAGAAFRTLAGAIAATGIGALVVAVGYLVANFDELSEGTGFLSEKLRDLTKWFNDLKEKAKAFIEGAIDGFIELYNKSELVRGIIAGIGLVFKTLVDDVITGGKIIANIFGTIGGAIYDIFTGKNPLERIKKGFEDIKKNIEDFGNNFVTNFNKALNETSSGKLDPIGNFFSNGEKKAKDSGKKSAEEFKKGFVDEVNSNPIDPMAYFVEASENSSIVLQQQIRDLERLRDMVSIGGDSWQKYTDKIQLLKEKVEDLSNIETPLQRERREEQELTNKSLIDTLSILDELRSSIVFSEDENPIKTLQERFAEWSESNGEKLEEASNWLSGISDAVGQIDGIIQDIFQIRINRAENAADREIAALQRTFDAATKGKNLSNAQQIALENKLAQDKYRVALDTFNKEEKLREKAFKANQAIQLVQAVIGTAQGVVAALSEPFFPLMLARMVMAATTGAIQIGVIASQKYQPGQAPTAPTPTAIPEPSLGNSSSSSSNGPDKSFQAAQFFGLGGKMVSDTNEPQYQKVYVTEGDISGVQKRINVIEDGARFL